MNGIDMKLGPCEGCGKPSDHLDGDGNPLCSDCLAAISEAIAVRAYHASGSLSGKQR